MGLSSLLYNTIATQIIECGSFLVGLPLTPREDLVLITGGSNGLGLELAKLFKKKGYNIIIADIAPPPQDIYSTSSNSRMNNRVLYFRCNVSKWENIIELYNYIQEQQIGIVTILINNAAIVTGTKLENTSDDKIENTIGTNYESCFYTIHKFLPDMLLHKKGVIVNISSVLGLVSPAKLTAYGSSKGALICLHECLQSELIEMRKSSSRVNSTSKALISDSGFIRTLLVCPGQIKTQMFEGVVTPCSLIAPVLEPDRLSKDIYNAIAHNKGILMLPLYTNLTPLFKGLAWPYMSISRFIMGMDKSMDTYKSKI
ncbi:short-chain dehydrogenase/reductase SCDLUD_002713 [Saccharomycodes ludwigii]|uniref:short-chain dehydrogenase/reductase n=1 Tax=Saccharomycodes ludwigii TaxID=36035 RepID=UPI001E831E9C|nr:hypothetical protein SCDLUD_002713 [Saccharomycodes ludwigii]KAH3901227.1 hypothetical protein SCDLUD_002713 [Saccharomycodes ludwigii]